MILSDRELHELARKDIIPADSHIGPCSVDLRLSDSFAFSRLSFNETFSLSGGQPYPCRIQKFPSFILKPGAFLLASTIEKVKLPDNLAGMVSGRSSVGRCGLQVQNAGFIDAGFHGQITLELMNQSQNPLRITAGMRICQLILFHLREPAKYPYTGKYSNQEGATASKINLDKN